VFRCVVLTTVDRATAPRSACLRPLLSFAPLDGSLQRTALSLQRLLSLLPRRTEHLPKRELGRPWGLHRIGVRRLPTGSVIVDGASSGRRSRARRRGVIGVVLGYWWRRGSLGPHRLP
jgi:hypothetical protein